MRPLGRTGIKLPCLGIGCGTLAQSSGVMQFVSMLTAASDAGLTFFDSAPLYGKSESHLGQHIAGLPREQVVLATKVGRYPAPDGARHFDFSKAKVADSIRTSLERLGTDYLDLLALHDLSPIMLDARYSDAMAELGNGTLECLQNLKARGIVRAIGVATYDARAALAVLEMAALDYVMIVSAYTLLSQEAAEELIPYCADRGIGVICASPFHSGILVRGPADGARYNYSSAGPQILAQVRRIESVCQRHRVPLPAAALQFPLRNPTVSSVVVGHSSAQELMANLRALSEPISEEFWSELR